MNNPKTLPPPPEAWSPPPERWFDRYEFPEGGEARTAELSKLAQAMWHCVYDKLGLPLSSAKLLLGGNLRESLVIFATANVAEGPMAAFRRICEETVKVGDDPNTAFSGILLGRKNRK